LYYTCLECSIDESKKNLKIVKVHQKLMKMIEKQLTRRHFGWLFISPFIAQLSCGKRSMANPLPSTIFQHWIHSREEDQEGIEVYRPRGYSFPPARGRNGFEFKANGEFIFYGLGATDRPEPIRGSWTKLPNSQIKIQVPVWENAGRTMEILFCNQEVLKIRWQG
jgi:hypothetical protein